LLLTCFVLPAAAQDQQAPRAEAPAHADRQGVPLPDGALARLRPAKPQETPPLLAVTFAPDGRTLATGDAEGLVHLWDLRTGDEVRRLEGHLRAVRALAFTPDGKRLISGGDDGAVRVWDPEAGRQLHLLAGHPEGVRALACSRDGHTLASAGGGRIIRFWDVRTGEKVRPLQVQGPGTYALAFSPDGKRLASGGADRTVRLWDVPAGRERQRFRTPGWVNALAFSADGKLLAAGGQDQTVHLWETASGELLDPLGGYEGPVNGVALSAHGTTAFAGNEDGKVRLWETRTAKPRRLLAGHTGPVEALALAPDESRLASASEDGTVLLWDVDGPEALWLDLGDTDASRHAEAVARLATRGGSTVAFLKGRMEAMLRRAFRVDELIAGLNSESFATRAKATRELEVLGELAEDALRQTLREKPALETQRRVAQILAKLPKSGEEVRYSSRLRLSRAVVVLERVGSPEARQLLETVAKGSSRSRLAQEARAALKRLANRPSGP
jgi:hypothetical protein